MRVVVTEAAQAMFGGIHASPRKSMASASNASTPCFRAVEM
jgi:hypothetical protein